MDTDCITAGIVFIHYFIYLKLLLFVFLHDFQQFLMFVYFEFSLYIRAPTSLILLVHVIYFLLFEPRSEKTGLRGF